MISLVDRLALVNNIDIARDAGARLLPACETAGITPRTLQRWNAGTPTVGAGLNRAMACRRHCARHRVTP